MGKVRVLLWNGLFRSVLFWAITIGLVAAVAAAVPVCDLGLIASGVQRAVAGDLSALSTQEFAFALASALAAVALALGATFFLLHVVAITMSIRGARRMIVRSGDMQGFATNYDAIHPRLESHPLIGHAWKEFDETLVRRDDGVIHNTVRPQSFINVGTARERLFGLKMIGSIPGFFVGVGLLLTFIGLVLALHKAADAVSASDANGMQVATRQLLQVATFKFATSIAGLGASIVLSFLFRTYMIWIEAAFDGFCHEVERKLRYQAPQSIASEMNDRMAEQVTQLKQINSADFFARMGQELTPQIHAAFATAMAPVTDTIGHAVERLADNSQSGMSEMIDRFSSSVQNGAGAELRELAASLKDMQAAMLAAQNGISGTGEDFGRRMSEAAENLNRLIADAGEKLGDSSDRSRTAMMDVVTALRETLEQANKKVDENLGAAAAGASAKVEEAMGRVLERLESQVEGLRTGLGGFQDGMAAQLLDTQSRVAAAQTEAVTLVGRTASDAAQALQAGLGEAMERINGAFDAFTAAMRSSEGSLAAQASAVREAADQSRQVADAFSRTAQDVRIASAPLTQSGERIAGATEKLGETVTGSVRALEISQTASRELAEALVGHVAQLKDTWTNYSGRFENVDKDLEQAVVELGQATERQAQMLSEYASKVDQGFATAIERLNPLLHGLEENTRDFGEAVEDFGRRLMPQAAE